jgi:aspartate aminotransferase
MSVADKIKTGMSEGSWIRKMFEEGNTLKQKYGAANVFDLSLGNPIVEPPAEFKQELKRLAENPVPGMHRYMENAGYAETRAAIAEHLAAEIGLKLSISDIVMTSGAAGALNVVLKTILNPADEVIVLSPFFVEYLNYIDNHGGTGKIVPTGPDFMPDINRIEAAVTKKTRAIILNSPNNPTGVVYSTEILKKMADSIRKKEVQFGSDIYFISDEPYRKIIYDGLVYPHILPIHPRSVAVTSHSKDLALPGERIGYIAVNPGCNDKEELINGFIYSNRVLGFVNAPALMQQIVRRLQSVTVSIADYQRKRDYIYQNLKSMGYTVNKPQGAFYFFPKSPVEDEIEFVRELQQYKVLTVPGRGFGMAGYIRITYCVDDNTIEGAMEGFRKAAKKYKLSK